jgi:hypothetical protein
MTLVVLLLTKTMHSVIRLFNHVVNCNLALNGTLLTESLLGELVSLSKDLRNVFLNLFGKKDLQLRVKTVLLAKLH